MRLDGRVALITGGSKGIGLAVAQVYAAEGAAVALVARGQEALDEAAQSIRAAGGRALALACDALDKEQVAALPALVEAELGPVDVLVNNAGSAKSHKFLGHPDALWESMLAMNLTSVYQMTKAFVPGMVERQWGRIINVASVASKIGSSYMAAYTASKHGVLGLTRALAVELTAYQITVNAICPGYVDTPMTDAAIDNIVQRTGRTPEEARAYMESTTPQNRLIQPEEVAAVALLLAGEDARGINGQAINVDGGAVMF